MSMIDNVKEWLRNWLMTGQTGADYKRIERAVKSREYRIGDQRRQMTVRVGQADDNLTLNFTRLLVDRSVSMLFGRGVTFDLSGDDAPEQEYIDDTWNANRKDILLHNLAMFGAESGDCFVKIIPNGLTYRGKVYHRLVAIDPLFISAQTNPSDKDDVLSYTIEYSIGEEAYREVTSKTEEGTWEIINYKRSKGGKWEQVGDPEAWLYSFPPIVHWQNLPRPDDFYGQPDITPDLIQLQDRINFTSSNISKIIRYHAHPKTIAKGVARNQIEKVDSGADTFITVPAASELYNLEMSSDLASSQAFMAFLRQSIFDISRNVDIESMSDKLGALTNFGLRVLYQDALAKNNTKELLYGDGLVEINRRLLILAGAPDDVDPGKVIFSDPLPENRNEIVDALVKEVDQKFVSRKTAIKELGRDFDEETERIGDDTANETNIGAEILRAFNQGGNNG